MTTDQTISLVLGVSGFVLGASGLVFNLVSAKTSRRDRIREQLFEKRLALIGELGPLIQECIIYANLTENSGSIELRIKRAEKLETFRYDLLRRRVYIATVFDQRTIKAISRFSAKVMGLGIIARTNTAEPSRLGEAIMEVGDAYENLLECLRQMIGMDQLDSEALKAFGSSN